MEHVKLSTSRDFRLNVPSIEAAMEASSGDDDDASVQEVGL